MRQFLWSVWEIFEVAVVAILTVLLVRSFLVQPFLVNGASMEPNFADGNYLLIDEITYKFRQPGRGEVVVFQPPNGSTYFIKRIIGLPGERLVIKNGEVRILVQDGSLITALAESYLAPGIKTFGDFDVRLKGHEYFVLGDNRNYSFDSRSWGALPEDNIIGLVRLRLWPLNSVMAFTPPVY